METEICSRKDDDKIKKTKRHRSPQSKTNFEQLLASRPPTHYPQPLIVRFISISDSQPKSSGIKMVDAWMLFSLVQPLVDVLLQTYLDCLSSQGAEIGIDTCK